MAEGTFDSEFFKEWENLLNEDQSSTMSLRKKPKQSSKPPSRLEGETEDQRDRRLRLARECSSRRRSLETQEQREKRLHDQRTRMALMRKNETPEERELRLKKAREREQERRRSETEEKRELRLKYSRERASLRRQRESTQERTKRLEASRKRAADRRKVKKSKDDDNNEDVGPSELPLMNTQSPTAAAKPRAKRTSRPRAASRRSKEKEVVRQPSPVLEYPMADVPLEDYKVCGEFGKTDGPGDATNEGIAVNNPNFSDSMVNSGRRAKSDVEDLDTTAQSSMTSLSSFLDNHHPSLEGDAGMTTILTTNPFHHSGESSAFQPPPPPPPPPSHAPPPPTHPLQSMSNFSDLQGGGTKGGGNVAGNGRVSDDILEGMGYLEHRYHHHPDFTLREHQNRGYNIQAVVLRNS